MLFAYNFAIILSFPLAVYFDSFDVDSGVEYTIRLKQEVSEFNSWLTAFSTFPSSGAGARVVPK